MVGNKPDAGQIQDNQITVDQSKLIFLSIKDKLNEKYYVAFASKNSLKVLYGVITLFLGLKCYNLVYTHDFALTQVDLFSRIKRLEENSIVTNEHIKDLNLTISQLNSRIITWLSSNRSED